MIITRQHGHGSVKKEIHLPLGLSDVPPITDLTFSAVFGGFLGALTLPLSQYRGALDTSGRLTAKFSRSKFNPRFCWQMRPVKSP